MSYNITVEGGTSVRLPTAGKYCDMDIIVTAEGGGGTIEPLTVTENGTYTPPEGVDGYSPVSVSVAPPPSDIDSLIDKSISGNIVSGVSSIGEYAFSKCGEIKTASFPNATKAYSNIFKDCICLEEVYLPSLEKVTIDSSNYTSQFIQCGSLKKVYVPKLVEVSNYMFSGCSALKKIDLPSVKKIGSSVFRHCYSLKIVILRYLTLCALGSSNVFNSCYHFHGTVNATYNPNGLKDGYIYVPRSLVDSYKTATNWSTFATQFRALEDYTVDGTITGELDESKI